ncbi:hypothetical protein J4441_04265 [Candidatus Micrarchaeota archaeon]|nr:hypothetical protein [Candidatus Micrarchaeota archaeon]
MEGFGLAAVLLGAPPDALAAYPEGIRSLMPIAIALLVVGLALAYMFAQFFKRQEVEQMVGSELYQLFVSLIIFLGIFSLSAGVGTVMAELTGGEAATPLAAAESYLGRVSYQYIMPYVLKLELFKLGIQHVSGLYYRLGPGAWSVQWPVFPGVDTIERSVDFVITIMTPVAASIVAQQIGMQFLGAICPILIAVGVLLRIFAPTRDAGSFMIVTGFAFNFVLPFTYYIHATVVTYMWEQDSGAADTLLGTEVPGGESATALNIAFQALRFDQLFMPMQMLTYGMLQGLFLPALSMVVTITFIKTTLKFTSQKLE